MTRQQITRWMNSIYFTNYTKILFVSSPWLVVQAAGRVDFLKSEMHFCYKFYSRHAGWVKSFRNVLPWWIMLVRVGCKFVGAINLPWREQAETWVRVVSVIQGRLHSVYGSSSLLGTETYTQHNRLSTYIDKKSPNVLHNDRIDYKWKYVTWRKLQFFTGLKQLFCFT